MQPNDPFQPAPNGIDYLNQIATPAPAAGFDKKTKLILIIFGIIGIVSLAFIFFMMSAQKNTGPSPLTLAGRLQKLQTISTTYGKKLRTTSLQDTNSSLSAVLTTANQSISAPLAAYSIDATKQAKQIAALDPATTLTKTLDEAYLNSTLDATYAREMNFQLEDTIVMMKRLLRATTSKSMKDFLETTIPSLENLQKQIESTTAA